MNRKDIIIITVLINIGLLSVLAMMAINTEDQGFQTELNQPLSDNKTESQKKEPGEEKALIMIAQNTLATDEWDTVLKDYVASGSSQLILQQEDLSDDFEPPVNEKKIEQPTPQKKPENKPEIKPEKKPEKETLDASKKTLEITVKRGDALEKIARANGTTVEKIRALNHLKNDRLTIGQVLLVPLEKEQKTPSAAKVENASAVDVKTPTVDEVEYYVIKSGDNPWKIAKQFHVRFDDLLKLNNLDEDKARNLKIGDRIRVK